MELKKNYSPQAIDELKKKGAAFKKWEKLDITGLRRSGGGVVAASISGHERNHVFFNSPGSKFEDLSGISGLDSVKDGRVFSLFDFDRDGWLDIAVVNSNYPLLNVYRNRISELHARNSIKRNVIAIRLVGGSRSSKPNSSFTSRDGFGAIVNLQAGDLSLMREHRCGDGMAAQNSNTILIGIGDSKVVEELKVTWPNRGQQIFNDLKAGTLITIYENPEQSPTKRDATFEDYLKNIPVNNITAAVKAVSSQRLDFEHFGEYSSPAKMRVFTSTADYCEACKRQLPQVKTIRDSFSKGEVDFVGVPVVTGDLKNDSRILHKYVEENRPAYEIMFDLPESSREKFVELKNKLLGFEVEPVTIVTDDRGTIYYAEAGVPNVSTLKKILQHIKSSD